MEKLKNPLGKHCRDKRPLPCLGLGRLARPRAGRLVAARRIPRPLLGTGRHRQHGVTPGSGADLSGAGRADVRFARARPNTASILDDARPQPGRVAERLTASARTGSEEPDGEPHTRHGPDKTALTSSWALCGVELAGLKASGQPAYFLCCIGQVRLQRLHAGLKCRTEPGIALQSGQIGLRQLTCRPPACPIHSRMNVRG